MVESNDFKFETDHEVIVKLCAEKRELQSKIYAPTTEVKKYKTMFTSTIVKEVDLEE
jgi:hypothetical protein